MGLYLCTSTNFAPKLQNAMLQNKAKNFSVFVVVVKSLYTIRFLIGLVMFVLMSVTFS